MWYDFLLLLSPTDYHSLCFSHPDLLPLNKVHQSTLLPQGLCTLLGGSPLPISTPCTYCTCAPLLYVGLSSDIFYSERTLPVIFKIAASTLVGKIAVFLESLTWLYCISISIGVSKGWREVVHLHISRWLHWGARAYLDHKDWWGPLFAAGLWETWVSRVNNCLQAIKRFLPLYFSLWLTSVSKIICPRLGKYFPPRVTSGDSWQDLWTLNLSSWCNRLVGCP